jgi:hypothetical protein
MKQLKTLVVTSIVVLGSLLLTACENTHVSGSMSYGMGYGAGYPMYYGNSYHRHTNVVVVKPARNNRSRPVRTQRR